MSTRLSIQILLAHIHFQTGLAAARRVHSNNSNLWDGQKNHIIRGPREPFIIHRTIKKISAVFETSFEKSHPTKIQTALYLPQPNITTMKSKFTDILRQRQGESSITTDDTL
ncbi:hypothetical protein QR680_002556 [Steinernema hermaphroditum]|uniref:Secreted protein n=1 Tax=Steinernema hermaphroditum TaxID=289476 RepID=A0AA39LHX3_9BILA|nr:hypothetical protein QR680_002556 [Steinernema hermaphroditum]